MATASAQASVSAHKPRPNMEKFTFTVGKLDAGMAILLGPNAHLIEFPSLLLPPNLTTGSIVTITVSRDHAAEQRSHSAFTALQSAILAQFGTASPKPPVLKIRNVTQTSVTIEWEPLELAQATVRGLEVFRNGVRFASVWKGRGKPGYGIDVTEREWKGSSLQSGEEYTFQLVLKTTAGTYSSNLVRVRTHGMNDTSGILVCFGTIQPPSLLADCKAALQAIGARSTPQVQIDTTHFVCTTPAPLVEGAAGRGGLGSGTTKEYERAVALSLPIVQPSWVFACAGEKKLMPISNYTLSSTSPAASQPPPFRRAPSPLPLKKSSLPFTSSAPPSPINVGAGDEIRRSPSPETIARMAMHVPGAQPSSPKPDRRDSIPVPPRDQPSRPRSPRAEADGRLDRGFKFPISTPPTQSPTEASNPSGPPADAARAAAAMVKEETESVTPPGEVVVTEPVDQPADVPETATLADKVEAPPAEDAQIAAESAGPEIEVTEVEPEAPLPAQETESMTPPGEVVVTEPVDQPADVPETATLADKVEAPPAEDAQIAAESAGPEIEVTEVEPDAPLPAEDAAEASEQPEIVESASEPAAVEEPPAVNETVVEKTEVIQERASVPESTGKAEVTDTIADADGPETPSVSVDATPDISDAGDEPKLSKSAKKKAKKAKKAAMEDVDLS